MLRQSKANDRVECYGIPIQGQVATCLQDLSRVPPGGTRRRSSIHLHFEAAFIVLFLHFSMLIKVFLLGLSIYFAASSCFSVAEAAAAFACFSRYPQPSTRSDGEVSRCDGDLITRPSPAPHAPAVSVYCTMGIGSILKYHDNKRCSRPLRRPGSTQFLSCVGSATGLISIILTCLMVVFAITTVHAQDETCATEGTCVNGGSDDGSVEREMPASYCGTWDGQDGDVGGGGGGCGGSPNLYRHGGSAQAYRPGAAVSSVVCQPNAVQQRRYKASSWPFTRRTTGPGTVPTLQVTISLWSCHQLPQKSGAGGGCACVPLGVESEVDSNRVSSVEVWQTRPDGTYSSLKSRETEGGDFDLSYTPSDVDTDDCRATVPIDAATPHSATTATFLTVAPGSTGIMGGLGPWGWENSPYGQPLLHTLIQAPSHLPLLLDIPVLPHHKTLEERPFSFASFDWRGLAWSVQQPKTSVPYNITSWRPNKRLHHIDIEVDVFLETIPESRDSATTADFCPSALHAVTPSAFFLEPIAVCQRYMLDFFPL